MTLQPSVTISIVLAFAYLAILATLTIVAALRAGGRREDTAEDFDALAVSRFTIPVSIIVPVSDGSASITHAVSTLLGLNYPEFELIVVADGAPQTVVSELAVEWQLEAREFFYRKNLETSDVRRIYRSGRDPRLMVIDKAGAGCSDALNCGVNVARYRYFMTVDPEVIFDRDALLRIMAAALRDPANVVGASSHVDRGVVSGRQHETVLARTSALFHRLASARSLMDSRLAWRYLRAGLAPIDAIVVWRRDVVIKLKGFSGRAADPDLDMMFRLQSRGGDGSGRFDRGVDVFGLVGPQPIRKVVTMAARRQLAALEILVACATGGAGAFDRKTLAYVIEREVMTPLAHVWIVIATLMGAVEGWFPWSSVILAIAVLSFGHAAVNTAALLLRGSTTGAPNEPELRSLLIAGPLDFVFYRSAVAASRLVAAARFVTGATKRAPTAG